MSEENIEKILCEEANKLIIEDGVITAQILDAELDLLDCEFNNDFAVKIDTNKLGYIILTSENLIKLQELIDEAEIEYEKMNQL